MLFLCLNVFFFIFIAFFYKNLKFNFDEVWIRKINRNPYLKSIV